MYEVSTHAYTNDPSHYKQLDLYIPHAGSSHSPLLVFVHGGAWRSEDKADHRALAEAFVARGYPVAVTNYRYTHWVERGNMWDDGSLWIVG